MQLLNTSLIKANKWELLIWLWIAYFLNQADRQIFSVVLPLIKADMDLSDGQLGLIASVLIWTYGVLVPIAGFLGDRISRRNIIGSSLLFWSAATLITGACNTLAQFILLRGVATGGGEAFYAPAANTLISEEHQHKRSSALAIHQTAVYFGIILSGLIAGYIATRYGWRSSFYLFGILGIIVAGIVFIRVKKDIPVQSQNRVGVMDTAKLIYKKPTIILLTIAFACMVFVNVAYLTWMPTLLIEKFKLSLTNAGFASMFYHHIGAFAGVIFGGFISDRIAKSNPANRLFLQSAALLLGAPFIYYIGAGDTLTITYSALFIFGLFRGIYDANIFASIYEVISPEIRSSASGLTLMSAFLAGAFSPVLLGYLKPTFGISNAMSFLWISYFIGALSILIAALFFFSKDKIIAEPTSR